MVYKETSSVDVGLLVVLSKNFFLWIKCPKFSLLLFKDCADLRMDSFSCKQSLHTLSFGANGFTELSLQNWVADNRTSPSLLPKPRVATKADLARPNTHELETLRQPGGPATHCYLCCEEWRDHLTKRKKKKKNGFTFLTISHLILNFMFLFFNFQTCPLSVVEVLLCSNLKDDLCKLNLVLNSFSVSPIYVSWLSEVVSVIVALYTSQLVSHLPSSGQEFFCRQLHSLLS